MTRLWKRLKRLFCQHRWTVDRVHPVGNYSDYVYLDLGCDKCDKGKCICYRISEHVVRIIGPWEPNHQLRERHA